MTKNVQDKVLTETVYVQELLQVDAVGTWQQDYQLTALEFERIKHRKSLTLDGAKTLLLLSIGYAIIILAKKAASAFGHAQVISFFDLAALAICGVLTIILYVAAYLLPNDRQDVMDAIEKHFKQAPVTRQLRRGEKS